MDVSKAADFRLTNMPGSINCIPTNGNSKSYIDLTFHKDTRTEVWNWTTLPNERTLDHVAITFPITTKKGSSTIFTGFN